MNSKLIRKGVSALCCVFALSLLTAKANTIFTLSTPNSGLSGSPGPYGTVTVHYVDATHATIEFVSNSGFVFLDGEANDWNLNGTASITASSVPSVTLTSEGSGNADGFGTFNTRYTSGNAGPGGRFTEALYSLTATGSTSWTGSDNVLAGGANLVAAHIGVGDLTGTILVTGFATAGPSNGGNLPDGGATLALVGVGLIGLGAVRRRL
jgi:hypothetical protein